MIDELAKLMGGGWDLKPLVDPLFSLFFFFFFFLLIGEEGVGGGAFFLFVEGFISRIKRCMTDSTLPPSPHPIKEQSEAEMRDKRKREKKITASVTERGRLDANKGQVQRELTHTR